MLGRNSSKQIAVTVSPQTADVSINGRLQFAAQVTNAIDASVNWSVNSVAGGNSTVGTIDKNGLYTAPPMVPTPNTVTVTATSVADASKSASALVTITTSVAVTVAPTSTTVLTNGKQQFTATVTGTSNTQVTWKVNGTIGGNSTVGTISTAGLYTAPAAVPSPNAVTVTATSAADPTKSASATITIAAANGVTVTPSSATLPPGGQQQFTATVTGLSNTQVTWSVNGVTGGNSTVGTISSTGLYTAPATIPSPNTVTVTATSVADTSKSGSATVTIANAFVTVFPKNRSLSVGQTWKFTSHVIGNPNGAVTWSVNGVQGGNSTYGTIDTTGLYTPPLTVPSNPNITITATSQAASSASATVNARIIPAVTLPCPPGTPFTQCYSGSVYLHVNETYQFTATVKGTTNTSVAWAVNGIGGGNSTVGTVSALGLYTAPATVPAPNMVAVTATSAADPNAVAVANVTLYPAKSFTIFPTSVSVLPGWFVPFQYYTNVYFPAVSPSYNELVSFTANSGTIIDNNGSPNPNTGVYHAPTIPGTDTVTALSLVDGAFSANAAVTVTSNAGPTTMGLIDTWTKVRPYEIVSMSPSLNVAAAQQQYASWQAVIQPNSEDLTNVDVAVSDFSDGLGNTISAASNVVIYFERMMNVFYISRLQGSTIGEYPDPLIPKVDPIVGQARNAFPFNVNRISKAYQKYPNANGFAASYLASGSVTSGGTYTGSIVRQYIIAIDSVAAGTETGQATFRWSDNGGGTYVNSVKTSSTPIPLSNGVTVSFANGATAPSFAVGQTWWIWAGPLRNQPIWIDLFVPNAQTPGNYTGTVTISAQGKSNTVLTVNLQVYAFSIPLTSSIPSWFGGYWPALQKFHEGTVGQDNILAQHYAAAALIDRITYGGNQQGPGFTYNSDGTVATSDYATYDSGLKCLAIGTCTVHGERSSSVILVLNGSNDTQQYYSTADQIAHHTAWGPNLLFDYTKDEPNTGDLPAIYTRGSLLRSVTDNFPILVTTTPTLNGADPYRTIGYINRWVPNWAVIGDKDYQRGSNPNARATFDYLLPSTDEVWWYDSCNTDGCGGPGGDPFNDVWPNTMLDMAAVVNQAFGFMGLVPYRVSGLLYFSMDTAIQNNNNMGARRVDPLDSVYNFGGNGDGSLFYPGCSTATSGNCKYAIGGTTDIGLESLRMKYIRDALADMEYGLKLISQGNSSLLATQIGAVVQDNYTYDPNPAVWANLRKQLGQAIK